MKCCSTISNSFPYTQQTFVFHVQISFVLFITILLLFPLPSSERFLIPFTISSREFTKKLLILSKNKTNEKNFHARLKQTSHLAHPKNFLYLPPKKAIFETKTFFKLPGKTNSSTKEKMSFTYQKNTAFLPKETFLIINVKNNFRDKNLLMKKTYAKKNELLRIQCVLNTALLFLC